ncbi:hypothetical protein F444_08181 [Phytophthora nicotianae P1976]|uniref:Uncharacterized protein n=1 Tax=Phytophthora nicotianae P1976 TaxID=1317066 RepID=A0A081AC03_PHYNI|nr:hypothetical protein F444_08181 [Phytophthora nicotianae P1976]
MEPTPASEERLPQQEVKRLVQEAMATKGFPPVMRYPETVRSDYLLSTLFSRPILVWSSECLQPSKKPFCTISGCTYTPRVKEYKQRVVEEVDTQCHLLYVKYQCTGANKIFFSTVSSAYLQREVRLLVHFPYILTKKFGLSKEVMELVQEGMLSPHGLTSTVDNMKRRREKRYYKLLSLFADRVRQNQLGNPTYMAPNPPIIAQYCSKQNPIGPDTLSVCEVMMRRLQVKKVLRIDHSVKFCKRLKVWPGGTGKRESTKDAKMLLLFQNEIGQIIGRRLTRSENNEETRALFEHVKSVVHTDTGGEEQFVVSDNANAVWSMVSDVFGAGVGVRQDPFHVVQRFTEKVKDKTEKTLLAKRLHDSIYDVDGCLRSPAQMSKRIKEAVGSVSSRHLNCSDHEWMGTLNNNLEQVKRGDLYVENNTYKEGGGPAIRVLSTSQLEGFHSALKKLMARSVSAEVGLRILDVFIL